ncbi:helix-turn-helix domain-containing protein [Nocardia wallacei]|uniref:helix-turn-helix domain-containing protein n=1 Tax=Nocardia wallacei TaxID=480035 RepID=UPI0024582CCE|nr:helix-turn-helix transcriptional regulator [Nocardia wallacei]
MNTTSDRSGAPDKRHERDGAHPDTDAVISLGSWMRTVRDHYGLTRPEAEDKTGISGSYIKDIENDRTIPRVEMVQSLIKGYRLDAAQTRLTWDLFLPPVRLPSVAELRDRIATFDRLHLLHQLSGNDMALVFLDPAWNILVGTHTFYKMLPDTGLHPESNVALWSLPPAPAPSPAEPLLADPVGEGRWLVGMLRGTIARYRTSPEVIRLYRQLSLNTLFTHHMNTSIDVAYGRDEQKPLRLLHPATRESSALTLQTTAITDIPEIRGFLAWRTQDPYLAPRGLTGI